MFIRKPLKMLRVKRNLSLDPAIARQLEAAAKKLKLPQGRIADMAIREFLKTVKETGNMPV